MFVRLVIMGALLLAACSINERSGDYTCNLQADCPAGRTCTGGLCVLGGGGSGSGGCPTACTSCNTATQTCLIDGGASVTCPAGWNCNVACTRPNSCDKVDCGSALSCTIACSGADSCKEVRCRDEACKVTCSGPGACDGVDCQNACACDVTCGPDTCNQKPVCPMTECVTPTGCSSQRAACNAC